ncbi:MAG: TIGR00725 family protein [Longimicrobiales bacterium]
MARAESAETLLPAGEIQPPLRVSVIGAGEASPEECRLAEAVGRTLAEAGAMVITGGMGGVMEAASRGCWEAGGITVGFLPGRDTSEANRWVTIPLATAMGESRNSLVVRTGEAVVAIGGSWGTLSEIALARKMGHSVVLLGEPPVDLPLPRAERPEEAAAWALQQAMTRRKGGSAPSS